MRSQSTDRHDHPADAPDPEDSRKPDNPAELTAPSWKYVLRTTIREFSADGCTDLAAGLTYRTVLSIFPALIALVSILGLFGQSEQSVTAVLDQAEGIVPAGAWETIRPALESILTAPAAGLGLVIGLLTALWSASRYTKAFGRAMYIVHDIPEGCAAAYYPETNALVPLDSVAETSGTPTSKSVPIRIVAHTG